MSSQRQKARELIEGFKGESYRFGLNCLEEVGALAGSLGNEFLLVTSLGEWNPDDLAVIQKALTNSGVRVAGPVAGVRPNAPREDVRRLVEDIRGAGVDGIVVVGGGSDIDAVKAASVLTGLGGDVEDYFGVGKVTQRIQALGKSLPSVLAVQTAASSAAHMTKYSNITDLATGQKKLIVDEAVVPPKALFDYRMTASMPPGFTLDGAFDGIAHCLEVFFGVTPDKFALVSDIMRTAAELIIPAVERAVADGQDLAARESLGLGTDLGGYAIMVGGTNGAHLTSFSLVDVLSHGRACAIMNPYYTVFFGPSIPEQLRILAEIYLKYGLAGPGILNLKGRDLALAVAEAMVKLAEKVDFPTKLADVPGFTDGHIRRALEAAKNPQLEMKLKNMPVPLTGGMIDEYMGPVLESAKLGDFSLIKNVSD